MTLQDDGTLTEELATKTIFLYKMNQRTPLQIPDGPVICRADLGDCSHLTDLSYSLEAFDKSTFHEDVWTWTAY